MAAHRVVRFLAQLHREHGPDALAPRAHAGPRRRLRHRLPRRRRPRRRARAWPTSCARSSPRECAAAGLAAPAIARRAGPGDRRAGHGHPLRGGHAQGRAADRQRPPLRQRGRRDERQHPHGALRRGVRRPAGVARAAATGRGARCRGWSASTASRATSSCATAGCPRTSRRATCSRWPPPGRTATRWPAATTGCRGPRWSPCATGRRGRSCAARPSTTSSAWRWQQASSPSTPRVRSADRAQRGMR